MKFFGSSLGKKYVMAVTGFLLFGFVVAHMLGNLQIFLGQDALNDYAKHLEELPFLLWPARLFLLTTLVLHIGVAAKLARENRAARPVRYVHEDTIQASYASRTMIFSGLIVALFIIYHLLHFTFRAVHAEYSHQVDIHGRKDVYLMVVYGFQNVWVSASYILAMAVLCIHLSHGLQSFFQSLGLRTQNRVRAIALFSHSASLAIFIGNCSIPVAVLAGYLGLPGAVL